MPVTSREFDMLRQQLGGLGEELEQHRQDHIREAGQRRARVMWAWGFALAATTLLESTLAVVLSHLR